MRFISRFPNLYVPCRAEREQVINGYLVSDNRHLGAQFKPSMTRQYEFDLARVSFRFDGLPLDEESLEPVLYADLQRVGVFDSVEEQAAHQWSDEDREVIEKKLLTDPLHGIDWLHAPEVKAPAPYARYVEHRKVHGKRTIDHAVKDIVAAVEAAGVDPDAVIAYERENGGSPEVVAAMEALKTPTPTDDEELVAA